MLRITIFFLISIVYCIIFCEIKNTNATQLRSMLGDTLKPTDNTNELIYRTANYGL